MADEQGQASLQTAFAVDDLLPDPPMADPATSPAAMIHAIEKALAASPAGLVEVQIDGTRSRWDRKQAISELSYWRKRHQAEKARAAGRSSLAGRFTTLDMSGGM